LKQTGELKSSLWDGLLFNKIKTALGLNQVRLMVSGSAPLSPEVMSFFRVLIGSPVVEGYGQTEGTGGATVGDLTDMDSVGHVGGPIPCVEIKLVDVPEMEYLNSDKSHGAGGIVCEGRGEIWLRGPTVFRGYYKDVAKVRFASEASSKQALRKTRIRAPTLHEIYIYIRLAHSPPPAPLKMRLASLGADGRVLD